MRQSTLLRLLPCIVLASLVPACYAGPRDASAVILHCGQATLEDTTVLNDHTVAGGHRILRYMAGTANFDRVGNDGWTFTYGEHRKQNHLTAEQLGRYMPCLTVALADSASPAPLQPVTTTERLETSMRRPYEKLIGGTVLFLLLLTIVYFVFGRRSSDSDSDD